MEGLTQLGIAGVISLCESLKANATDDEKAEKIQDQRQKQLVQIECLLHRKLS